MKNQCIAAIAAVVLSGMNPAYAAPDDVLAIDTHVDIPQAYMQEARFDAGADSVLKVDLAKMERGVLDAAFFVVYVEQGPLTAEGYREAMRLADEKYDAIEALVQQNPGRIRLATGPQQVRQNHQDGVLSAMIGIENGYSLGRRLDRLDAAHARGARYLGLTHTGHNAICTSSGERPEFGDVPAGGRGLSGFGRSVVLRANRLGMMIDVSHASDACVREVLQASAAPVIASHSAAHALVPHPRNINDGLLRGIADSGGVVQVVAYTYFLKPDPAREAAEQALQEEVAKLAGAAEFDSDLHDGHPAYVEGMARIDAEFPIATLDDYMDHVDHVVSVAGIDHVGLASDFDGGGGITGWMDASETANVTRALRERGYGDEEIDKLWGGNLLRVWAEVERIAAGAGA